MANLAATREAVTRFIAELPLAGVMPERLRRQAEATHALVSQALDTEDATATWADHNISVLIAGGLTDPSTQKAASHLFGGVRRRLSSALLADPDDLSLALALARGATRAVNDSRITADMTLVVKGLSRPQAGAQLASATVALILAMSKSEDKDVVAAASKAAPTVQSAVETLGQRLPNHPDLPLDLARLDVLAARQSSGEERGAHLDRAHGRVSDQIARLGSTAGARQVLTTILELRARAENVVASDIRRESLALLDAETKARSLRPKIALRLVRAIERSKGLDADLARQIAKDIEALAQEDTRPWREVLGILLAKAGDESALRSLWEKSLLEGKSNTQAAQGLARMLVRNLRQGLSAPFESPVLDKVLELVPYGAMARWNVSDIDAVLNLTRETFGTQRAATFARERLMATRDLRQKPPLWERTIALQEELGQEENLLKTLRAAVRHGNVAEARLRLCKMLLDKGQELDEAENILKPLLDKKGPLAAEAQALKSKLLHHPEIRQTRQAGLVRFEEHIGVGSPKAFKLKVIYTSDAYVLVEAVEHKAPSYYDHRYLRTMVRKEDLPGGVSPHELRKGDILHAPLRGQNSSGGREKDSLRVYWIADASAIRLESSPKQLRARLDKEEQAIGIGGPDLLGLKVAWDNRRDRGYARIFSANGDREFHLRAAVKEEQLPEGFSKSKLGKGRRMWGQVAPLEGNKPGKPRRYEVVGQLTASPPDGSNSDAASDNTTPDRAPAAAPGAETGKAKDSTKKAPAKKKKKKQDEAAPSEEQDTKSASLSESTKDGDDSTSDATAPEAKGTDTAPSPAETTAENSDAAAAPDAMTEEDPADAPSPKETGAPSEPAAEAVDATPLASDDSTADTSSDESGASA